MHSTRRNTGALWRGSLGLGVGLVLAGTAAGSERPDGGLPTDPGQPAVDHAAPQPAGLTDTLEVIQELRASMPSRPLPVDADAADQSAPEPFAASELLAEFDQAKRENAVLELELPQSADAPHRSLAELVEAHWNQGEFDEAIAVLRNLEALGHGVNLGIAWKSPLLIGSLDGPDRRVGNPRTGAREVEIDHDAQTGRIFATVLWDEGAAARWTMNRSTNGGSSWSETYSWFSSVGIVDVDAVVVDDFVYVAYVSGADESEGRLRRCSSGSGSVDAGYGFQVIFDVGASTILDVALASNADDFDNRIYYFFIQSNNRLRFAWDAATDGTTFTENATGLANAASGLDATWDNNFTCPYGRFISYLGTDSRIHIIRHNANTNVFQDVRQASNPYSGTPTSISAYGDNVICAYEYDGASGRDIRYQISYDCGDSWNFGNIAQSGSQSFCNPTVTARGGQGTAAIYQQEVGEPDNVFFKDRSGYSAGQWNAPVQVNELDVVTGTETTLNWLPPVCRGRGYGWLFISDLTNRIPYFDSIGSACPGDTNGDREVDVLDLLNVLMGWGPAGSNNRADTNCDGFVDVLDLLEVLMTWGSCGAPS